MEVSNIHEAFTDNSLSIGGISRALNDPNHLLIRALLNIILGDIILFLNVGKTMNAGQLVETVDLVVKHYGHFKPKDFKLCIEGVKKGNHGPLYDRIDGQVILSWFKAYDLERDYVAAEVNSNRNEEHKMHSNVPLLPEFVKPDDPNYDDTFKANIAKLRATLVENKRVRDSLKAEIKPRHLNPMAELHNNWIQQFDDLYYMQRGKNRMVHKYGLMLNPFYKANEPKVGVFKLVPRMLDINAYLEHKQWQYQLVQLPYDERMNYYLTKYQ